MTTSYIINLTNPWIDSFNVSAFASNGPIFPLSASLESTAVAANTSLIIYGKGHPNYGERIEENLVHLMENFSGSVEPQFPISGQLWFQRFDVIRTGGTDWYEWNLDTLVWDLFVPSPGAPAIFTHGEFFFNTPILTRVINSVDHPMSPTIATVEWADMPAIANPNAISLTPQQVLQIYDGASWIAQNTVRTSDTEPTVSLEGDMWFDTAATGSGQLKIFIAGSHISIAENYLLLDGSVAMTGALDMGTNLINNVVDPVNPQDAATRAWVLATIASGVTSLDDLSDVSFTGGDPVPSITRPFMRFDIGTSEFKASALLQADISDVTASAAEVSFLVGVTSLVQGQLDGKLNLDGTNVMAASLDMNNNFIINVLDPVNPQDAATRQWTLDEIDDAINALSLVESQTETDYDNILPNGTFVGGDGAGGTAYVALDTITLSDGSIITVGSVDANDDVLTFTVTTSGGPPVVAGVVLTQTSTSGTGTAFTLTPESANLTSPGLTDTFLESATLNTVVGSPTEGLFTMTRNDAVDIAIAGFAVQGHTHDANDITYTPISSTLTSQFVPTPASVGDGLFTLDNIMRLRTSPRRLVHTVIVGGTGPFPTPQYEPGRDKLQVFKNGVKQIGDFMANDAANFGFGVDGSVDTGLLASTLYTFTTDVDGGGATVVSVTTPAFVAPDFVSFDELVVLINAAFVTAVLSATSVFEDGTLEVYSDTHGAAASLLLADTTLFVAITGAGGFSGFDGLGTGTDFGYQETGSFGDTSGASATITTIPVAIIGDVFEMIVLGDSGV